MLLERHHGAIDMRSRVWCDCYRLDAHMRHRFQENRRVDPSSGNTLNEEIRDMNQTTANEQAHNSTRVPKGMATDAFGSILSEDINWISFPAYPPQVRLAVLVGDPLASGPYVVRVRLPKGLKFMPHMHKEDRIYTIISGVFYVGRGDTFNPDALQAYAPGSVIVLPRNTHHFHWAKSGDYVAQVSGYGPLSIDYLDHEDDPRHR